MQQRAVKIMLKESCYYLYKVCKLHYRHHRMTVQSSSSVVVVSRVKGIWTTFCWDEVAVKVMIAYRK